MNMKTRDSGMYFYQKHFWIRLAKNSIYCFR
jgi:hypothetical protein